MLAPGGFDSNIDGWPTRGVWKDLRPLDTLAKDFTLIAYDRREAGLSGGRDRRATDGDPIAVLHHERR